MIVVEFYRSSKLSCLVWFRPGSASMTCVALG